MREVILYLAMSLDGFIADSNGGVDWLHGHGDDPDTEGSYPEFIRNIDTVLMGWNTYHQITTELSPDEWPYEGLDTWIFTHRLLPESEKLRFTDESPSSAAMRLKLEEGKGIWVCGGADLAQQLIQDNLIDRIWISVVPVLLGNGIRLFQEEEREIRLQLIETRSYDGIVDLVYKLAAPAC